MLSYRLLFGILIVAFAALLVLRQWSPPPVTSQSPNATASTNPAPLSGSNAASNQSAPPVRTQKAGIPLDRTSDISTASNTSKTSFRVGLIGFVPPYAYGSPPKGSDVKKLNDIARYLGYEFEMHQRYQNRLPRDFSGGNFDIIVRHGTAMGGCFITEPFAYWQDALMVPEHMLSEIRSLEDLVGKRVGTYAQFEPLMRRYRPGLIEKMDSFSFDPDTEGMYRRLMNKRVDANISDINLMKFHHLTTAPEKPFPFKAIHYFDKDLHRLCANSAELRDRLNDAIRALNLMSADSNNAAMVR